MSESVINKRQIMVVEDDPLIAMLLEDMLAELEFGVIGPLTNVPESLAALQASKRIDAAILDFELQGRQSLSVADDLLDRGIPFAFVSGYEPEMFARLGYGGVQILAKPFAMAGLHTMLRQLLERHAHVAQFTLVDPQGPLDSL